MSVEEYANDTWPRACLGGFYTTRVDTIAKVWKQASKESLIRMDDVWITGILRQKAGIPDSCVVKADFKAWLHTWGYRGKGDLGSRNFMKIEWERFSEEISKRPHCGCSSTSGLHDSFIVKLTTALFLMFVSFLNLAET